MNKPRHAMIDLETMGTHPDSAIVSIGGVIFDPRYNIITNDTFYVKLDWRFQERRIDPDTQKWWKKQSPSARAGIKGTESLRGALDDLTFWLPNDVKVWGNGPTFDISMLEDAYRQHEMDIPWYFWDIRDVRTIKDLYEFNRGGLERRSGGDSHNALSDAIYQAEIVCKMWRSILKK